MLNAGHLLASVSAIQYLISYRHLLAGQREWASRCTMRESWIAVLNVNTFACRGRLRRDRTRLTSLVILPHAVVDVAIDVILLLVLHLHDIFKSSPLVAGCKADALACRPLLEISEGQVLERDRLQLAQVS